MQMTDALGTYPVLNLLLCKDLVSQNLNRTFTVKHLLCQNKCLFHVLHMLLIAVIFHNFQF